jgi:hypothetical protein
VFDIQAVSPDWEVVLRVDGSEVCILAAFAAEGGMEDVCVGVQSSKLVERYADLLEKAAVGVRTAKGFEQVLQDGDGGLIGHEKSAPSA